MPRPNKIIELNEARQRYLHQERSDLARVGERAMPRLYTLRVSLIGGPLPEEFTGMEVSRTIQIRGDQTLEDLHEAIFDAFEREEEHLYEFNFGTGPYDPEGPLYGVPDEEGGFVDEYPVEDATKTTVESLQLAVGRTFGYEFDFGDEWMHQIEVMAVEPAPAVGEFPRLVERVGESPPQYSSLEEDKPTNELFPAMLDLGFIDGAIDAFMDHVQARWREEQESKPLQPQTKLQAALNKLPAHWVEAICRQVGLPAFRLGKERVKALVAYLPKDESLAAVWQSLPDASRDLLRWILGQGGFVTIQKLSAKFGKDEDRTWWWNDGETPTTPLGLLRVRGLVFVGRAGIGGRNMRIAAVPVELREGLRRLAENV